MPLLADYSMEDYSRMLTIGRWVFGVLAVCTVAAGTFTQWASSRIVDLHREERTELRNNLQASQEQLRRLNEHTAEVRDELGRLSVPRQITRSQSTVLKKSLQEGPRGKVIVTFHSLEWDADEYAGQIVKILLGAGFDAVVSDHLWPHLDHDGLFFCSADSEELPPASPAAHIQRCFVAAGISLAPTVKSEEICKTIGAPEGAAVIVVSNRK